MQLCILSVVVPVCSQPAQAVTGKETFAGVKAVGTCINGGKINEKYRKYSQSTALTKIRDNCYLTPVIIFVLLKFEMLLCLR